MCIFLILYVTFLILYVIFLILYVILHYSDPNREPPLPLIRLIVKYYDDKQQFNVIRVGQQYTGRIANPQDCVMLKNLRQRQRAAKGAVGLFVDEEKFKNVSVSPILAPANNFLTTASVILGK